MSVILISNVAGKIPTVSQLLTTDSGMGYNRVDGLFYALRITGNTKQVICIGASINPTDIHARLHDINSIVDHNPVEPENRGKYLATDPENGGIVFLSGLIPEGEKHSATHAGKFGEMSLSDDYLFLCVKTGSAGNAIWKRTTLHQT
jgi:hypothetical protein